MTDNNVESKMSQLIAFKEFGIPERELQGKYGYFKYYGPFKRFTTVSRYEWGYIGVMAILLIVLVSFTIVRIHRLTYNIHNPDFAFCVVLIINSALSFYYIVDGVLRERPSEILLLSIASVLMATYLAVNYAEGQQTDIKLARLIIASVSSPVLAIWGLRFAYKYQTGKLYKKVIGTNPALHSQYTSLSFFKDFLKFDSELQTSLLVLMFGSRASLDTFQIVMCVADMICILGLLVSGMLSFRWTCHAYVDQSSNVPTKSDELACNICAAILFYVLCVPGFAYMGYKVWHLTVYIDDHPGLAAATIACLTIGVLVRILVMGLAARLYIFFRNGKQEIGNREEENITHPPTSGIQYGSTSSNHQPILQ